MTFKVYNGYMGTKCIKKFDNLQDAQTWCWIRDRKEPYRVEWTEPADEDNGIRERKNKMYV